MNTLKLHIIFKRTLYISLFLMAVSCSAPKNITYFQGSHNLEEIILTHVPSVKYKPQDIISIVVSAADPETVIPFNNQSLESTSESENIATSSANRSKYLINNDGFIAFPVLGEIKVAGLTANEVKSLIKEKLKPFINNPIISVQLENFSITVLGAVNSPGPIVTNKESLTLIEAIGISGDLTITGKRTNITVIRQENNKKVVHKVDITSKDIFNSPVYHLKQNDIVYVEPNNSGKRASQDNQWTRTLTAATSVITVIISIVLLTR